MEKMTDKKEEKYIIKETIDKNINNIFVELVKGFDLKSGDITPAEAGELAMLQEALEDIVISWVDYNKDEE